MNESESRTWIVSRRTRWLAIATGCITAVAGSVSITVVIAIVPILLILGAVVQPRHPRTGLGMMLLSALFLSSWVIPLGIGIMFESVSTLQKHHDFNMVAVTALYAVSFFLVICCDVALAIEYLKVARRRSTS